MSLTKLFKTRSGFGSSPRRRPHRDYTAANESLEDRTLLSAGSLLEFDKLTAGDAAAGNLFGFSVAVSADGETVVVGSQGVDPAVIGDIQIELSVVVEVGEDASRSAARMSQTLLPRVDEPAIAVKQQSVRHRSGRAARLVQLRPPIGERPNEQVDPPIAVHVPPRGGVAHHPPQRVLHSGRFGDIAKDERRVGGVSAVQRNGSSKQ